MARAQTIRFTEPVVVKDGKKKRKGREYSQGLQSIQQSEVALTRGANRFAEAVSQGLREYRRSRDSSSRKKRDGLLIDCVPNIGRGLSRSARVMSDLPYDLSRAISHREFRNGLRFFARTMSMFKFTTGR
jgi:hypothetical protein